MNGWKDWQLKWLINYRWMDGGTKGLISDDGWMKVLISNGWVDELINNCGLG